MKSILQTSKECWFCGRSDELHVHHVIYGQGYKKMSDKYGLTVWLCPKHHNMSNDGVHFNKARDLELKQYAQKKFEQKYSHELWMQEIGRNYL